MPESAAPASPIASHDAAWISLSTPFSVGELAELCRDIEVLFRLNPYLYFEHWNQTGPGTHRAVFRNRSNGQSMVVDLEVCPEPDTGFSVVYGRGLKRRTVFKLGASAEGSRLTIADDYGRLNDAERSARIDEVDRSLPAWGEALRQYFLRQRRWSWLPGWRWYMRRVWIPMNPSARRVVWMIYLIGVVEFFFFLFVLLIYVIEQNP